MTRAKGFKSAGPTCRGQARLRPGVVAMPAGCWKHPDGQAVLGRVADWFPPLHRFRGTRGQTGGDFRGRVRAQEHRLQAEVIKQADMPRSCPEFLQRWVLERWCGWRERPRQRPASK